MNDTPTPYRMPAGRFRGWQITDVQTQYLLNRWNDTDPKWPTEFFEQLQLELERRNPCDPIVLKSPPKVIARIQLYGKR